MLIIKGDIMQEDKKQCREYVEAVPGPAIIISKSTYEKIKANNTAQQNKEKLQEKRKFFKNIINKTELPKEDEKTL